MKLRIFEDKRALSEAAAQQASAILQATIAKQGRARIVVATGASQLDFLDALTHSTGIDWPRVEMFHLDEYVGLPITHDASFRKYLMENLISKTRISNYHLLDGEGDPEEVIRRVGKELLSASIDAAFVGIGENGHLAFNDPPADFQTEEPYLIVELDEACRRQQVGEGWFANISEVPQRAISMSVRQILKSKEIVAVVPDTRKAEAVKVCLEDEISPMAPASILRSHPAITLYLDKYSAALLDQGTVSSFAVTAKSQRMI
ncbi:MAG TPA: glucosamine-6-phosphate deaminase [Candidatus Acidoferrales bacterium]